MKRESRTVDRAHQACGEPAGVPPQRGHGARATMAAPGHPAGSCISSIDPIFININAFGYSDG